MKVLSFLTWQWISLEIICNFDFYFNNTEITSIVLDGGDEIILANWPNDKHIICNINNIQLRSQVILMFWSTESFYAIVEQRQTIIIY